MGNNCYIWFELDGSNDTIDKIYQELNTIGFNGCYGFSDIQKNIYIIFHSYQNW